MGLQGSGRFEIVGVQGSGRFETVGVQGSERFEIVGVKSTNGFELVGAQDSRRFGLSSAEAPVSKHQRKKQERERWREKTGARGTRGRGKRRERSPRALISLFPASAHCGCFFSKARLFLNFPLPSLRALRVLFSQGATVGGLCRGEREI